MMRVTSTVEHTAHAVIEGAERAAAYLEGMRRDVTRATTLAVAVLVLVAIAVTVALVRLAPRDPR